MAKILGKHRSTVQRWLADYRQTGIETMLEFGVSTGRTRVIPNWAVESLKKQLEEPEIGFAGYKLSSALAWYYLRNRSQICHSTSFSTLSTQSKTKGSTSS
ncbi:MAG: helix-turn-helix domain-containing protein [Nostoc sp. JL31]|nr:helix-turn-helix domain-containing protein [Nostoc sp. JL31]